MTEFWGWLIASSRRREELLQPDRCVCACVAATWWVSRGMFEILNVTKANVLFKVRYTLSVIVNNKKTDEENLQLNLLCISAINTQTWVCVCVCLCSISYSLWGRAITILNDLFIELSRVWGPSGQTAEYSDWLSGFRFRSSYNVSYSAMAKKKTKKKAF